MFLEEIRSSKTFATLTVCTGIFTDMLIQMVVVPVLPYALSERVGLSTEDSVQRWNSILLAAFSGTLMLGSCRRAPFLLGLVALAGSTASFAVGNTLPILLMARLLEGISAAIVLTLGMALLNDVVGPDHIGKAIGYTTMATTMGLLFGPPLGGFLYEYGGYFQVFLPAFGLLAVEAVLRLLIIEPRFLRGPTARSQTQKVRRRQSPEGEFVVGGGLQDHRGQGTSPDLENETEPLLGESRSSRSAFVVLLSSPRFAVALLGLFILDGAACSLDGVLTPYMKDTFGLGTTYASIFQLLAALPVFLSPIAGAATDRYGAKCPTAVAMVVTFPSLVLLGMIDDDTAAPLPKLATVLLCFGVGYGGALTSLRIEGSKVVAQLEQDHPGIFGAGGAYAQACGLINMAIAAGGFVGPLYAGFTRVAWGWKTLWLSWGLAAAVLLVLVIALSGRKSSLRSSG
ncbi:MAG: hypothetical protein Q9168_006415 [Polycauliona sp. 1 TL-2023]